MPLLAPPPPAPFMPLEPFRYNKPPSPPLWNTDAPPPLPERLEPAGRNIKYWDLKPKSTLNGEEDCPPSAPF